MQRKPKAIERDLRRIVDRLVELFDPERIILFGSHARGQAGKDSDLDLLVVMVVPGSKREKQLEVRRALPRTTVPVDVIVTRPEDYSWRKEVVGTIEWPAAHKGKCCMSVPDPTAVVAAEWMAKAENDLKNATHVLKMGKDCPTDRVCFHAQQCVEKCLKALLVLQSIDFPKTHNVRALTALVPERFRPHILPGMQDRLTEYGTVTRYLGEYEPIPLAEARAAVQTARQVLSQIRKVLTKEPVRRKKH